MKAQKSLLLLSVLSLGMAGHVSASTSTWKGATGADWSTVGSWTGTDTPPVAADTALFNSGSGTVNVANGSAQSITSITFDTAAATFVIGTTGSAGLNLQSGGTIQIASSISANKTETINAPLVLAGASGAYTFANNSTGSTLNFGGGITGGAAGATVLTLGGSNTANTNTISGVIATGSATSVALTTTGGVWALTNANTYAGATTVNGGTLVLNKATSGTAVSTSSALVLGGGTLSDTGTSTTSQAFNGTTVNAGGSTVSTSSATGHVLALGAISRAAGGTVNFSPFSTTAAANGSITTTQANVSGILGGYATFNGTNFAVGNGTISGFSSYNATNATSDATTTDNNVQTAAVTLGGASTINSLTISDTGNNALALAGNNLTLTYTSATSLGGLLYAGNGAGGGSYTISSTGGVVNTSSTTGELVVDVNTGATLTISAQAVTSGATAGQLTKGGGGTLSLTSATNAYTGATNISAGTLSIGGAGQLGGGTYNGAIVDNGAFVYSSSANQTLGGVISGVGTLTQNGSGTLTLTGANTFTGGAVVNGGTLQVGNGTSGSLGGPTDAVSVGSSGTLLLNGSSSGLNVSVTGAGTVQTTGSASYTISGGINGTGSYVQNSSGVITISSFSESSATLNNGALKLSGNLLFGGSLSVALGANMEYANNTGSSGSTITDNGTITGLEASGKIVTLSGVISGTGGFTQNGNETILSNANTFSGTTLLTSGILGLSNASGLALQDSTLSTSGAGTIALSGSTTPTFGGITGGTALASVITSGYTGSVTNLTLNPQGSVSDTYSGVIADGHSGMTLTKSGTGTQTLSGNNTYTGATQINAGVLAITNTTGSGTGGGAVTVGGGANSSGTPTLMGTGTITGNVVVSSASGGVAGTITPGVTGSLTGTLHVGGAISFQTGSLFADNLSGANAGELVITGAATVGSGALISITGTPISSDVYTLATATAGSFSGSNGGFTFTGTALPSGWSIVATNGGANLTLEQISGATNGSFSLNTTAVAANVHAGGGTTTVSTVITNSGTTGQDTLTYSSLQASVTTGGASGSVSTPATGTTSGSGLALGANNSPGATQTFTSTSTAGSVVIGNSASVTNTSASGTPNETSASGTTINVYSGQSSWSSSVSGSWGTLNGSGTELFGANWTSPGGSPGLDPSFKGVDKATFGSVGSSPVTVALNNASPNLNSITFGSPLTSYTLSKGSGSSTGITLSGTAPSINVTGNATAGSQTISAPLILNANTSLNVGSKQALTVSGVISDISPGFSLTNTGPGATFVTANNTYTGGTVISGGTFYANNTGGASYTAPTTSGSRPITASNTSGSATGTAGVTVQSGGTFAGSGTIASTSGGITVQSGGILSSGGVQSGTSAGAGLTINNAANLSNALIVNGGATLTFALGSTTTYNGGSGALNFDAPNTNSTYLSITGGTTDLVFSNTTTMDNINLIDLTNGVAPGGVSLTLRAQNPYLLIQTALGGNDDFANLWTTGGEGKNGYVLGVSTGSGNTYTAFNLNAVDISGNVIGSSTNLQNLRLYLYNGDLEVVPEPGTWVLMLGGLSVLIFLQRRRRGQS